MIKKGTKGAFAIQQIVWSNIRRYQYLLKMTDDELGESLGITSRTLYTYDKDPSNLTLDKVEHFLKVTGVGMESLIIS